jgi:hypothetical protein
MTPLQEIITTYLRNHPNMASVSPRIHWITAPQNNPTPYIVCTTIGTETFNELTGTAGLKSTQVQFMLVANTQAVLFQNYRKLEECFIHWPINVTYNSQNYEIAAVVHRTNMDMYDEETQQYYIIARFDFYYRE